MAKKKKIRKSKIRAVALNVILACCIIIMLFSGYKIVQIVMEYKAGQDSYDVAAETAGSTEFTGNIDFDALKAKNSDVIGWIYLKDTPINYPVVQGTDNDRYLYTLWDGSTAGCGSIFADYRTSAPFKGGNTILYGHHMRDGSMFKALKKFTDEEFGNAHSRFEIITPDKKYHLDMLAFLCVKADSEVYQPEITDKAHKQKFLDSVFQNARYTTDRDFSINDTFVTLSTCAYEFDDARYIVVGKLTPWSSEELEKAASKK